MGPAIIGFGGWAVGGRGWGAPAPDRERIATLRRAFEGGIRLFDTAPIYGESEAIIGRALSAHRDELWLATKVGPRDDPARSLEASLQRLGTDRVDLLTLHEVGEGFEESLEAMFRLRDAGRVVHLGLSNATPPQIQRAKELAGIEAYQGPYNMFDRDAEHRVLPVCVEHGIAFLAYRPLASGQLSGSLGASPTFDETDHRSRIYWFRGRESERRRTVIDRLLPMAGRLGLPLPALALRWVLGRPGVRVVLVGARTPEQVDENLRALDGRLAPEDLAEIDAIMEDVFRPPISSARARELATGWGPRERFIVEHLDGRWSYEGIATAWSDGRDDGMTTAQVKVFADQLIDRGLAASSSAQAGNP